MKKMQCEVCGSTEIKKVTEDLFACQSCGVQYSAAEAKKLLTEMTDAAKTNNTDPLEEYFIVDPDVDPRENVRQFFTQLATVENIACDIFGEITVKSVTERFVPFCFVKAEYRCDWSATACTIFFENQTVYKEEYDYQLKKRVSRPVTEKVQKVKEVPKSGTHLFGCQALMLASDRLRELVAVEEENVVSALLSNFETQQNDKYAAYKPHKIAAGDVETVNGKCFYRSLELDTYIDPHVCAEKKRQMADRASEKVAPEIVTGIGGDYHENMHAIRKTVSETVANICIPVQIIEYTYKGKTYVAVSDLLSHTTTMPVIYPCDTELAETKEIMRQEESSSGKIPVSFGIGVIGFLVGVVLLLCAIGGSGDAYGIAAICLWIVSLIPMIAGVMTRKARMAAVNKKIQDARVQLRNPRKVALTNSYGLFMAEYRDYADLAKANKTAAAACVCIEKTHPAVSGHRSMEAVTNEEAVLSAQEREIMQLEEEIAALKKKRIVPIILMTVFGVLVIPLLVGTVLLGNVNAKINEKTARIQKMETDWVKSP